MRGRRLDDDVVETPILSGMRKALLRRPGFQNDVERFVEPRVSFFHRNAETREFAVAITFADAEIEPPAGEKIDGRCLFGEQHRIVPWQHQHRRAKP